MSIIHKRTTGYVIVLLVLCHVSAIAIENESLVVINISNFANGHCKVTCSSLQPEDGLSAVQAGGIPKASNEWPSAVISASWHWESGTEFIYFNLTPDSKPDGGKIKKVLKKFINKRAGNDYVPEMKLTSTEDEVQSLKNFKKYQDFLDQFYNDGKNTIVMTEDDQFFKDESGEIVNNDVISTVVLVGKAEVEGWTGNDYFGKLWIVEADVFLNSGFFNTSKSDYQINCTAAFRMAHGYRQTCWSHDYLSSNRHHVTSKTFGDSKSKVWSKVSYERDDFYYLDDLAITPPDEYLSTPRLLPFKDEVIDIGGYTLPSADPKEDRPLAQTPLLFLTNLKAWEGKKKMSVQITRVPSGKIVKLKGNCYDYPMVASGGENFYPDINLAEIRLGKDSDLSKLQKAVETYGAARTIDGISFDKALKIKVKIVGRLSKTGKKQSITQTFWLADTAQ